MNETRTGYSFFKTMVRITPIQFESAPLMTTAVILIGALHALIWTASIIATQVLFDAATLEAAGGIGFTGCVIPLLILAGVTFGQQIINGLDDFTFTIVAAKSAGKIRALLQRKLQRVEPALFEDTSFLDDINKAGQIIYGQFHAVTFVCLQFYSFIICFFVLYFASIGVYLFSLKPLLLITLLIAFIPAMLAQVVKAKVFTKLEDQSAPLRRKYEYYQKTLCDREYFKETRILGAFGFFHKLFSGTMLLLTWKTWQAERKTALLQLLLSTTSFAGMAISAYMLFTATMAGEITVGAFAAVFGSLGRIFGLMETIIDRDIGGMAKDIGKVANFIRILDTPERTGAVGMPDYSKGISAENISFTYPGRDKPTIRDVSLTITGGETIAIVGENGAGKSTLVRLLTGVYCPSSGKVMVGGMDIAKTAPQSIFKGISGVFQKYQRYKMTLAENVSISDVESAADTMRIKEVLKEADTELGLDFGTMLSPEFDGIDLSGGQWQRVAIARGLYRKNSFIVLDEPTSAIDPIEETKIYTQFQKLAAGKCAVIVTHRLGSAKLAHRIIVMDGGRIIDTGTHTELLSRPGKYADMWTAQAKWYEREYLDSDAIAFSQFGASRP